MSNTANIALPLLQPAQAQKHVTVNEALAILDGVACLTLKSATQSAPPVNLVDGETYFVAAGGTGGWSGQDGKLAVASNGGWVFVTPAAGWRGWIEDIAAEAMFDGTAWRVGAVAVAPGGAASVFEVLEFDHVVSAGATNSIAAVIPAQCFVHGVTARVTTALTGALTGWRIGVAGSDDRYGTGYGLAAGSWARGLTSSPLAYYNATDLLLTGEGGAFATGDIRVAVHLMRLALPY